MEPAPFVRGCAWPAAPWAPYPRCDPADYARLPVDTWGTAQIPATVRLELLAGAAGAVTLRYRTATDNFGYRGAGAGTTFAVWQGGAKVDEAAAVLGDATVTLTLPSAGRAVVYLPEGMKPVVLDVAGDVEPAPAQPRWYAYGDSLAEGWIATEPARAWPAVAARALGLDVHNFGYAGAARGEIASAEQLAALPVPAVVSVTHGTNCWTRTPHSEAQMRANTDAFLSVLRAAWPDTPVVVASPVVRPDAESTPNRLGATLRDLRRAMEECVQDRAAGGDRRLTLVPGADVLSATHLPDGIHPGDEGHAVLADVFGAAIAAALA